MSKIIKEFYTFDDVLLRPQRSGVFSRKDVSTSAQLSKHINLHIPLLSANMDSVTESRMARFMAEAGGIGIIHRFLPIEKQVEEVRKVKRAENVVIEDPYTISESASVEEAQKFMKEHLISGLPVLNMNQKVVGIITRRDILFTENLNKKVSEVMTKKVITGGPKTSFSDAKKILFSYRIEKLPLVDSKLRLKGLITLKDILKQAHGSAVSKDKRGRFLVGAAVGVKEDTLERARALLDAGADILVLDIAHGHNERALNTIKLLKQKLPGMEIIGGNVATAKGVIDLIKSGADAVKVGIGPGAACTTRIVTGVGVPQLSAIFETAEIARKYKIPIIADGGIRNSGDLSKALAAGGYTAMIGGLLAGTDEAPGEYILEDGASYKLYRGMASREASEDKLRIDGNPPIGGDGPYRAAEGKSGKVYYRGKAGNVVGELIAGLRSSMSYLGAKNLKDFQKNAEFVRISPAGLKESHPHDMKST
ncbi:MAG: IMP dehydrogenase [bacterium]|nr:IMP dehydrogenase [bacterium]